MAFVTSEQVRDVFDTIFNEDLTSTTPEGGRAVERVDMVEREDRNTEEPYYMIFVHFKHSLQEFHDCGAPDDAIAFMQALTDGEEKKVVYSGNWFWKCRVNKGTKRTAGPRLMTVKDEEEFAAMQAKRNPQAPTPIPIEGGMERQ